MAQVSDTTKPNAVAPGAAGGQGGNGVPATPIAKPVTPPLAPNAQAKGTTPEAPKVVGAPATPPFTITPIGERSPWLKFLVYGDYGTGKTRLSGTAALVPEMRDVILINAESGDLTLLDDKVDFSNIDVVPAQNFSGVGRVYDFLALHCQYRDANDEEKLRLLQTKVQPNFGEGDRTRRYKTVIVDSLSEVEQYCMMQLLGVKQDTRIDLEVAQAEWGQFRQQHSMIQRLVRSLRNLPMHVIFTCAQQFSQDDLKRMQFGPAMTGKLSSQVQGFMDLVGYMTMLKADDETQQMPRRMFVQPIGRFSAKCRFSNYKKAFFDDPTMGSILTAVGLLEKPKVAGKEAAAAKSATPTK